MCGNHNQHVGHADMHNEVEITILQDGSVRIRTGAFDAPVHASFDSATRAVMAAYDEVQVQRLPQTTVATGATVKAR